MNLEGIIKKIKGVYVSPVRCITRVFPIKGAPVFALVLTAGDEGDHDRRMEALRLLSGYNATCSFVITGKSAADDEFVHTAAEQGFELISGGYSGRPFSSGKNVPSAIPPLVSWENVFADVKKLDDMVNEACGYKMTAGMPPFGVENITGAANAYDLYDCFGYQLIRGSLMLKPGEEAVLLSETAQNKDALNGQIVTGTLDNVPALVDMFAKLGDAGYGVCSVKDLLDVSPFSDIGPEDPVFEPAKKLLDAGYPVAMRNNRINPRPYEIMGDTLMTFSSVEDRRVKVDRILEGKTMVGKCSVFNPYCAVLAWARPTMGRVKHDFPTTSALLVRALLLKDIRINAERRRLQYRRGEMIRIYSDILCATEEQDPYGVYEYHMSSIEYDLRREIGDEAFEELKKEVEENRAARALEEGKKESARGTILDRFERRKKTDIEPEAGSKPEHKDNDNDAGKDQIIL